MSQRSIRPLRCEEIYNTGILVSPEQEEVFSSCAERLLRLIDPIKVTTSEASVSIIFNNGSQLSATVDFCMADDPSRRAHLAKLLETFKRYNLEISARHGKFGNHQEFIEQAMSPDTLRRPFAPACKVTTKLPFDTCLETLDLITCSLKQSRALTV